MVLHDLEKAQGKSFNKMATDMQKHLEDFEAKIRADERKKVLEEFKNRRKKGGGTCGGSNVFIS